MKTFRFRLFAALALAVGGALIWSACGGSNSSSLQSGGSVTTVMSDPATCSMANGGPYSHVYVTVTDVRATISSSDSGWQDLTPGLSSSPKQVDLLGQADTQCFLATLGDVKQLPPGKYQQIRIQLLANSSAGSVSNNQCGSSAANCVVLSSDGSTHPLLLSSEAQTGIKIPTSQIAGGQLTVANGQAVDLDIDFNSCASIVVEGNGSYRLKPVLTAGQVGLQSTSISGTITDNTGAAITGPVVVALERPDSQNIDRVVMQTSTDSGGNFVFCPVPAGTYDVVADAISNSNVAYAATITSGVTPGTAIGKIPLVPEPATPGPQTPVTINGQVTSTSSTSGTAAAIDVTLSALQPVSFGTTVAATIPLPSQSAALVSISTAPSSSSLTCSAGTDCAAYSLVVPAANPSIGSYNSAGTTYSQNTSAAVNYTIDGIADAANACGASEIQISKTSTGSALQVTPALSPVTAQSMDFTGCTTNQ